MLQVKMGYSAIHPENLYLLTSVASEVAAACAQPPPGGNPFVGTRAFAHKGGLHVAAVRFTALREHSGNFQVTFREHSENTQGTFREH
jgi:isopropylmalate/homocitrate/citramalate synthase